MNARIKYERLKIDKENPVSSANFLSIISFWWMNSILQLGSKRQIENDDLFHVLHTDKTRVVTDSLRNTWNQGLKRPRKCYRLLMSLLSVVAPSQYMLLLSLGLLAAICNISQTVFLGMILSILLKLPGFNRENLYLYGAVLCLCSLVRVILLHQFLYKAWLIAMRWRTSTMGLMFNKVYVRCIDLIR